MNDVFLITGSNIGDRKKNLRAAQDRIHANIGTITTSSHIYETEPWGNTNQATFYNQVHRVKTILPAREIMSVILNIESEMGRVRTTKNAARIIDIDILFFNNEIISSPFVTVPHKEMTSRNFVLQPLCEIVPQLIHPQFNCTVTQLLQNCTDTLKALPLNDK